MPQCITKIRNGHFIGQLPQKYTSAESAFIGLNNSKKYILCLHLEATYPKALNLGPKSIKSLVYIGRK